MISEAASADICTKLDAFTSEYERTPFATRLWPEPKLTVGLRETLVLLRLDDDAKLIDQTLHAAHSRCKLLSQPIVAVMGQLNSGKSSVVASLLSEASRARVPRGEDPEFGTNRFVYWAPASWKENELVWSDFLRLLTCAHDEPFELLDEDPAVAAQQYRSGYRNPALLRSPLIGVDAGLNSLGFALLDCPDVQRRDGNITDSENYRLNLLVQSAQLCSAYLVVWGKSQVGEGLLQDLLGGVREKMPKAPLYLLVNKIRPETGQPTRTRCAQDVQELLDRFTITDCYAAFDFDMRDWKTLTPPALGKRFQDQLPFPQFFSLSAIADQNAPATVCEERFLHNLPAQLPPAELQIAAIASQCDTLESVIQKARDAARKELVETNKSLNVVYHGLKELCVKRFKSEDDSPRQLAEPTFARAIEDSMQRTTPWYLYPSLAVRKGAVAVQRPIADFVKYAVKQFHLRGNSKGELEIQGERFFVETPQEVAQAMVALPWWPIGVPVEQADSCWALLFEQLRQWKPDIDKNAKLKLDSATKRYWDDLEPWKRSRFDFWVTLRWAAMCALNVVSAISALLAIVDLGATLMTYEIANQLVGHYLLAGALASAGVADVMNFAFRHNTLPALSYLFASACNVFGVPRQVSGKQPTVDFKGVEHTLPKSAAPQLPVKVDLKVSHWKLVGNE